MPIPTLHLVITGRVQGVGFRWFIHRAAERLALAGWVRNLADGRVELEAQGDKARLDDLLRAAREGPPGSHVTHVAEEWGESDARGRGFAIRRG
jgi:acylphosphatase